LSGCFIPLPTAGAAGSASCRLIGPGAATSAEVPLPHGLARRHRVFEHGAFTFAVRVAAITWLGVAVVTLLARVDGAIAARTPQGARRSTGGQCRAVQRPIVTAFGAIEHGVAAES